MANPQCKIEQRTKAILPCGIALDLAANVADDAAKSRAQEFEFPPSALEMAGMRIAPHHNGRASGHAQMTLDPQPAFLRNRILAQVKSRR